MSRKGCPNKHSKIVTLKCIECGIEFKECHMKTETWGFNKNKAKKHELPKKQK